MSERFVVPTDPYQCPACEAPWHVYDGGMGHPARPMVRRAYRLHPPGFDWQCTRCGYVIEGPSHPNRIYDYERI